MKKHTKIVATIGPASDNIVVMEDLIKQGVNVFRMNFSHGDHKYHKSNIDKIRSLEQKLNVCVGVLQDICGPKIRVGKLENNFNLKTGDKLIVQKDEIIGKQLNLNEYEISINHPQIHTLIQIGEYIYLCDGQIRAKVIDKNPQKIIAEIENDGILSSNKGVNFPNTKLNIDVITPKDKIDLEWGAKNGVDFVAISFVQSPNDIKNAREILNKFGSKAKIFAKIEKFEAVENIDEIISLSDGIMVARGDLGIEVPFYKVPSIQKSVIKKANEAKKPVITATQMMLSMAKNETATRAEISDVANAVLDGTDAVMLSEESAVGINPVAVVKAMSETIIETEKIYPYDKFDKFKYFDETDIVANSAARLAESIKANAIISITKSGSSALKIARNRPKIPILAVSHDEFIARSLCIAWGIKPCLVVEKSHLNVLLSNTIGGLYKKGEISKNATYVVTAGHPTGVIGSTDLIRILKKEQINYYLENAN